MLKKENTLESPSRESKLMSTAVIMAVIVVISKGLGLLRDVLVAHAFGTGVASQAYEISSKLPIMIFDFVIGGVVTAAFTPIFSGLIVKKGQKEANKFAAAYINLIVLITSGIAILGIIFSPLLVKFLAPEASSEVLAKASTLSKIMFPMIIFTGLAFSFVGILQSLGEFKIPALISLVSNLIMVGYLIYQIYINDSFGVTGLSFALLLGWFAQAVVQIPSLRRRGFKYTFNLHFKTPEIKNALSNSLPILIGTWTTPICSLINTRFASGMNNGRAISALSYSNKLYIIIVGIFSFVATNLLFPYMSRANASGDTEKAKGLMVNSIKILIYIIAPIAVGIFLVAEPFIQIMYQRGAFTYSDTLLTAGALKCYAVGMLFMAVNEVLTKAFFSRGKVIVPMVSSLVAMGINIIAVISLSSVLNVGVIALISGLSTGINCAINYFVMNKEDRVLVMADFKDIIKSVSSALIMGIPIYLINKALLPTDSEPDLKNAFIRLAGCVAVGLIVYIIETIIIKSDETTPIINKLFKKS